MQPVMPANAIWSQPGTIVEGRPVHVVVTQCTSSLSNNTAVQTYNRLSGGRVLHQPAPCGALESGPNRGSYRYRADASKGMDEYPDPHFPHWRRCHETEHRSASGMHRFGPATRTDSPGGS